MKIIRNAKEQAYRIKILNVILLWYLYVFSEKHGKQYTAAR